MKWFRECVPIHAQEMIGYRHRVYVSIIYLEYYSCVRRAYRFFSKFQRNVIVSRYFCLQQYLFDSIQKSRTSRIIRCIQSFGVMFICYYLVLPVACVIHQKAFKFVLYRQLQFSLSSKLIKRPVHY